MTAPGETHSELRGIVLICAAVSLFSCLDASAKYLSAELPVLQIVWVRFTMHLALMVVFLLPRKGWGLMASANLPLQMLRALLLFGTTLFNFLALRELQLSVTVSIMFTAPLFVAALSVPLLGEHVGRRRWIAILIGFSGVILVTRPGAEAFQWATLYSFAAAACFALYSLTTRLIARYDTALTTIFYTPVAGALILGPAMPFLWISPSDAGGWALLLATGLLGGIGHYMMVLSHRHASAAALAPFTYAQIVTMVALGFFVFADVPASSTIAGAVVVIASGLYLISRRRA